MNISEQLEKQLQVAQKINDYIIEIGVITSKSTRKVKVGINNAELMFIHEHGSPLRSLPARPVLAMTIAYTQDNYLKRAIDNCIDGVINKDWKEAEVELELKKLCMEMENYARDLIYKNDGRLAPNAPSTVKRKGDNHPLFDTGQLARSITCRLVKSK